MARHAVTAPSSGRGPLGSVASVARPGSRQVVTIERHVGGGTQGDVYRASMDGAPIAVKWYSKSYLRLDPHLRRRLERLTMMDAPNPHFIWPLGFVEHPGVEGFGYLMTFFEPRFRNLRALLGNEMDPSFRTLVTVGCHLAQGFLDLHARGLAYCDINFGNVWFDPDTAETLICDNDNVDVNGRVGAIPGSPRFMAPEIVRGESGPNIATDAHSLAVLLFWMLMLHHPLVGRAEFETRLPTAADDLRLFGTDPRFIFDPQDDRNTPVPGHQDVPLVYWPIYPAFLRSMFTQAFTRGLQDPSARVMESVWRRTMVRLRDTIFDCHACGAERFYDPDAPPATEATCWQCGAGRGPIMFLQIGAQEVVLARGAQLFPHHLTPARRFDFSSPMAQVVENPARPDVLGIKNLSQVDWLVTLADGSTAPVGPGLTVKLEAGMSIDFWSAQAVVVLR